MDWYGFRPYVSVAQRRAKAAHEAAKLRKKGQTVTPIKIEGRAIANTFWGKAWCEHLESYSDFENRLPRGRTYVRNGSVFDLRIEPGKIVAMVSGSEIYHVTIKIEKLSPQRWKAVRTQCAGQVGTVLELLQGRFDKAVMAILTDRSRGLFPAPAEISMKCSCPDWAVMCKHVAAVLYGVGARLDHQPEMLFKLRQVDHLELLDPLAAAGSLAAGAGKAPKTLDDGDLADVFGIELASTPPPAPAAPAKKAKTNPHKPVATRSVKGKPAAKRAAKGKPAATAKRRKPASKAKPSAVRE